MRIAITGGKGSIAQAIAKKLIPMDEVLTPDKFELNVSDNHNVGDWMCERKPNILINCAGYIRPGEIKSSESKDWIKQIEVNLIGTYLCSKYALLNGCQMIINIASSSGFKGRPNWSAYCASKAGVISLTQSLAEEGIMAYCISPHRTKSKMRKVLFPNENQETLLNPEAIGELVADVISGMYPNGSHIVISKKDGIKIQD